MDNVLTLNGVHHSARPTWRLKDTVEFYRDKMGLKLVHAVSARGWGPANHPDFLHFFFDNGAGGTIAFFFYLGDKQPDHLVHRPEYDCDAIHTAWKVNTRAQLQDWRARLESHGVEIMYQIEHEVIESIYFRDPNGYYLEIAFPLRGFLPIDSTDAEITLQAAIAAEERSALKGETLRTIGPVWRTKGEYVARLLEAAS